MLRGQEAGLEVSDVKELVAILDNERSVQADSYRQPPAAVKWSVDTLASELLDEESSRLSEWERQPSIKGRVPSLAALASPVWLCALYLEDSEKSAALRGLQSLLVSYWSQPLPADAVNGEGSSLALLLLVKALSEGEQSLARPLRESLRNVRASLDDSILRRHRALLEPLLRSAAAAAGETAECTAAQRAAVEALLALAPEGATIASPPTVFASFNVCALLAAVWESDTRHGTRTSSPAHWKALASLVSGGISHAALLCILPPLLLTVSLVCPVPHSSSPSITRRCCWSCGSGASTRLWTRWSNGSCATRPPPLQSCPCRPLPSPLGFSSRHLSLREDAASALLDRPPMASSEWEKQPALLTAIATSDQLPLFARSSLFSALSALLLQRSRGTPPSPSAAALVAAAHRLLGSADSEKGLLAAYPVEEESWVAQGWSLPLSLGYLVRRGFHGEAVALLFDFLQTQAAFPLVGRGAGAVEGRADRRSEEGEEGGQDGGRFGIRGRAAVHGVGAAGEAGQQTDEARRGAGEGEPAMTGREGVQPPTLIQQG